MELGKFHAEFLQRHYYRCLRGVGRKPCLINALASHERENLLKWMELQYPDTMTAYVEEWARQKGITNLP